MVENNPGLHTPLHQCGHSRRVAASGTHPNTPPLRESGAGGRSRRKPARAPPAPSVFPGFCLPNPLSFLTLLNKGGLILHGLAELVQSPSASACAQGSIKGRSRSRQDLLSLPPISSSPGPRSQSVQRGTSLPAPHRSVGTSHQLHRWE